MYTIGDRVLDHVKENPGSTSDGLKMLELPNESRFYPAANIYLSALNIIKKMQKEIKDGTRPISIGD